MRLSEDREKRKMARFFISLQGRGIQNYHKGHQVDNIQFRIRPLLQPRRKDFQWKRRDWKGKADLIQGGWMKEEGIRKEEGFEILCESLKRRELSFWELFEVKVEAVEVVEVALSRYFFE